MLSKTRYVLISLVAMVGISGTATANGQRDAAFAASAFTTLALTAAEEFQLQQVHRRRYRHSHGYRSYRNGYRSYRYRRYYRPYSSYRYRYRYGYYPRSSYYGYY